MHIVVRELLKELYPGFRVEEEKRIDTGSGDLPIDLTVPQMMLCVECHGVQHFEFNTHFHKVPEDFTAQKQRDREKKAAIRRAGYAYLCIRYDEYETLTTGKLAKMILKALTEKK
jgi:very-short-patch-repair endonuclease